MPTHCRQTGLHDVHRTENVNGKGVVDDSTISSLETNGCIVEQDVDPPTQLPFDAVLLERAYAVRACNVKLVDGCKLRELPRPM